MTQKKTFSLLPRNEIEGTVEDGVYSMMNTPCAIGSLARVCSTSDVWVLVPSNEWTKFTVASSSSSSGSSSGSNSGSSIVLWSNVYNKPFDDIDSETLTVEDGILKSASVDEVRAEIALKADLSDVGNIVNMGIPNITNLVEAVNALYSRDLLSVSYQNNILIMSFADGKIITCDLSSKLSELSDVNVSGISDGQCLEHRAGAFLYRPLCGGVGR